VAPSPKVSLFTPKYYIFNSEKRSIFAGFEPIKAVNPAKQGETQRRHITSKISSALRKRSLVKTLCIAHYAGATVSEQNAERAAVQHFFCYQPWRLIAS
jgi:hypothetical protein